MSSWQTRRIGALLTRVKDDIHVDGLTTYSRISIRMTGNGVSLRDHTLGAEISTKRQFITRAGEAGDLLFSNVFAWEGAIATTQPEDTGRFGSHPFISCVADRRLACADFLRYFFLTGEGMEENGKASPGGAGRNRTLDLEKMMAIAVPIPLLSVHQAFDAPQAKAAQLKSMHAAILEANAALVPATLERLFSAAV